MTPADEASALFTFDMLAPMGGQCVTFAWKDFGDRLQTAVLAIEVEGKGDPALVEQINVGIAGSASGDQSCWGWRSGLPAKQRRQTTCLLEEPRDLDKPEGGGRVRTWRLRPWKYAGSGDATFVFTNAALQPWTTKGAEGLTVRFGFARTEDQSGTKRGYSEGEHLRPLGPTTDFTRRTMYGIRQYPPMPDNPMTPPVSPLLVPKDEGEPGEWLGSNLRRYRITPDPREPIPIGYAGPLYGLVELEDPDLRQQAVGNLFCIKGDEKRLLIGRVLAAEMTQLKVHVQVDVCEMDLQRRPPWPVVDRLDAIVVLPFGWRYQRHPVPDVVTPGIEEFIERFSARLDGRWDGIWPAGGLTTGMPGGPPVSFRGGRSGPGPGAGGPGAGGLGLGLPSPGGTAVACDCSCDGFKAFAELSRSTAPGDQEKLKNMAGCATECLAQWMACRKR